ncbi:MAG: manganese catalase family protein [Clostridia bacterium]|nr:manganese catalase family protein [Clostridia bacterium]
MWIYERKLQYPVKIKDPNPQLASLIISQLGGPDGELSAAMRYLNQRYSMPCKEVVATLTDIGTEELAHLEIISAILYQLTRNVCPDDIAKTNFAPYFVDHTTGIYPIAASGVPNDMKYVGIKGDALADLSECQAAEQKARVTYDNLIRLSCDCPDVMDPLRFLREREVVHFQRFGDSMRIVQDHLDGKNFYAFNPSFDKIPADRSHSQR